MEGLLTTEPTRLVFKASTPIFVLARFLILSKMQLFLGHPKSSSISKFPDWFKSYCDVKLYLANSGILQGAELPRGGSFSNRSTQSRLHFTG